MPSQAPRMSPERTGSRFEIQVTGEPDAPALADLLAYWERKRAGRIAPRRIDIDPVEMREHLPNIFLLDVLENGADFRYRLLGTSIVDGMGRDSTGKRLSELYGRETPAFKSLHGLWATVVTSKRPVFARGTIFWLPARDIRRFAGAYMPLSEDGVSVNMVLSELFIFWPGDQTPG